MNSTTEVIAVAIDDAQKARKDAAEAREEAESHVRDETLTKWEETLAVFRRLRDHSRADTFTAMVQHELTRREEQHGI